VASAIGTFFMAFYARLPFALVPSISVSIFFTYTLCLKMGYTFAEGMAAIFVAGVIYTIVTLLKWRETILLAIPDNLKYAVSAGIGFYIAFMGFQKAKIIVDGEFNLVAMNSFQSLSRAQLITVLLTFLTVVITAVMMKKQIHGAMLLREAGLLSRRPCCSGSCRSPAFRRLSKTFHWRPFS
jgi:AGZA family xanthine/uracil permease-like MFS transporter